MSDDLANTMIRTNKRTVRKLQEAKKKYFDNDGNKLSMNSFIIELLRKFEQLSENQNKQL